MDARTTPTFSRELLLSDSMKDIYSYNKASDEELHLELAAEMKKQFRRARFESKALNIIDQYGKGYINKPRVPAPPPKKKPWIISQVSKGHHRLLSWVQQRTSTDNESLKTSSSKRGYKRKKRKRKKATDGNVFNQHGVQPESTPLVAGTSKADPGTEPFPSRENSIASSRSSKLDTVTSKESIDIASTKSRTEQFKRTGWAITAAMAFAMPRLFTQPTMDKADENMTSSSLTSNEQHPKETKTSFSSEEHSISSESDKIDPEVSKTLFPSSSRAQFLEGKSKSTPIPNLAPRPDAKYSDKIIDPTDMHPSEDKSSLSRELLSSKLRMLSKSRGDYNKDGTMSVLSTGQLQDTRRSMVSRSTQSSRTSFAQATDSGKKKRFTLSPGMSSFRGTSELIPESDTTINQENSSLQSELPESQMQTLSKSRDADNEEHKMFPSTRRHKEIKKITSPPESLSPKLQMLWKSSDADNKDHKISSLSIQQPKEIKISVISGTRSSQSSQQFFPQDTASEKSKCYTLSSRKSLLSLMGSIFFPAAQGDFPRPEEKLSSSSTDDELSRPQTADSEKRSNKFEDFVPSSPLETRTSLSSAERLLERQPPLKTGATPLESNTESLYSDNKASLSSPKKPLPLSSATGNSSSEVPLETEAFIPSRDTFSKPKQSFKSHALRSSHERSHVPAQKGHIESKVSASSKNRVSKPKPFTRNYTLSKPQASAIDTTKEKKVIFPPAVSDTILTHSAAKQKEKSSELKECSVFPSGNESTLHRRACDEKLMTGGTPMSATDGIVRQRVLDSTPEDSAKPHVTRSVPSSFKVSTSSTLGVNEEPTALRVSSSNFRKRAPESSLEYRPSRPQTLNMAATRTPHPSPEPTHGAGQRPGNASRIRSRRHRKTLAWPRDMFEAVFKAYVVFFLISAFCRIAKTVIPMFVVFKTPHTSQIES